MGIANCSSLRGVVLSLIVLALSPSSSQARELLFSTGVTLKQAGQLGRDLANNVSMPDDQNTEKVMGVNSLSDAALKQWLSERIGYVIGEGEKDTSSLVAIQKIQYPNNIFPNFETPNQNVAKPSPRDPRGSVVIVMSNVGASYYYIGKSKEVLVGYKFTDRQSHEQQVVPITSPRVGILKVGDGLFMLPYKANPGSIVNTWFRLITLFHEAHHSDGNGKSLGFPHAVCPEGHPYYNYNACDREVNGAYGVEAFLLRHVRETCVANKSCNEKEAEILAQMVTDAGSRLLAKNFLDPKPEGVSAGN